MVRFLHLADVHLGFGNEYLGDNAAARSEEFKVAFRDAVETALDEHRRIDGVIVAGDLFEHHRPSADLWSFARGLFSRLLAKDKIVALVPGMHDSLAYKNSVWRTERLPGVEVFLNPAPEAPRVRDVRGTRVFLYGLAHVPGQTPQPLAGFQKVREAGVHIGILHGFMKGHPEWVSKPHQLELDPVMLAKSGLDYLALGGLHGYHEQRLDGTTLVYPGALEGRGFATGETGDKGAVVVEFQGGKVSLERLITSKRTIVRRNLDLRAEKITDAGGLKNAINALSGRDVILELTLTGHAEFVADLEEVQEQCRSGFFFLSLVDESRIVDSALLRKIESENTIRGYFVRKLGARIAAARTGMAKKGPTPEALRELQILDHAMKLGVEQFVEEEAPADSIYSLIPDSDEMVGDVAIKEAAGIGNLEERVKAMIEYRKKFQQNQEPVETKSLSTGVPVGESPVVAGSDGEVSEETSA